MKNIRVVAFDCDGVLFDTEAANWAYYNHILAHFGRPSMTADQFAYAHQHTLNESIAHLFGDTQSIAAVHTYRQQMDYGQFLKYLKIEPHLTPLLRRIRPPINTAIATNRTDTVDRLLAERIEMQERNQALSGERDRLLQDRTRVSDELDRLLDKLERLEGKT